MSDDQKREFAMIAKNSGLSIGLALTMAVFIFFGGRELGKMEAELNAHKDLTNVKFEGIKDDIADIKATQTIILDAVTKE